jgi:hypothetical protein
MENFERKTSSNRYSTKEKENKEKNNKKEKK